MADRVTVIGWDGSPLPGAATAALSAATLVAGAAHHLALPEVPPHAERIRLGSVDLAARRIAGHRGSAVVLADGDPGFFGVVRTLRAREHGLEVEVVPAVSSVATAFARAGMPWDDAQVVVAHPRTLRRAVNVCRAHHKVAVLTSPGAGPAELALLLDGVHRTFVICEELGTARERVTVLTSDKAADHAWRDPNVVIVIGGGPETTAAGAWIAGRPPAYPQGIRGWALPAEAYRAAGAERMQESGEGEFPGLRAAQLARLGPRTGDLVWDIGSAAAPSPSRPPASARRSWPWTTTRPPAPAPRPPPAPSASPSRSSAGAPRTSWNGCPNRTSYGSAAGESRWPGPSSTGDRNASSRTPPTGTRPRPSARPSPATATPSSARCSSPSTWTPRCGPSARGPSCSCSPRGVPTSPPDPFGPVRKVGWRIVVPHPAVRRFVRQCPEKWTVLVRTVVRRNPGDAQRGAVHSEPWQNSLSRRRTAARIRSPAGVSCRAASPLVLDDEHRRAVVRRPGRRAEGALTMGEGYA